MGCLPQEGPGIQGGTEQTGVLPQLGTDESGPALEVQDGVHPFPEWLEQVVACFSQPSTDHHGFGSNNVHALADSEGQGINGISPDTGGNCISGVCPEQHTACTVHTDSRFPVVTLGNRPCRAHCFQDGGACGVGVQAMGVAELPGETACGDSPATREHCCRNPCPDHHHYNVVEFLGSAKAVLNRGRGADIVIERNGDAKPFCGFGREREVAPPKVGGIDAHPRYGVHDSRDDDACRFGGRFRKFRCQLGF